VQLQNRKAVQIEAGFCHASLKTDLPPYGNSLLLLIQKRPLTFHSYRGHPLCDKTNTQILNLLVSLHIWINLQQILTEAARCSILVARSICDVGGVNKAHPVPRYRLFLYIFCISRMLCCEGYIISSHLCKLPFVARGGEVHILVLCDEKRGKHNPLV
jgi:hypothetical protein